MDIVASGILARGEAGSSRALLTFAHILPVHSGALLATCRYGSTKDSDDEGIEFYRSTDGGATWSEAWRPFAPLAVDGVAGTLKLCYLTELAPGHLIAVAMWIDRATHPGKPLFNPETEGCLPMSAALAESHDEGQSWTPWRVVPMPEEIGPASVTGPLLKLANGELALTIETNKTYSDSSKWYQKVVFFFSSDQGQTWSAPVTAGKDPSGRIFNWDLRCGVAPDGRIATFAWTYDTESARYVNIHRRVSDDQGRTWSQAGDLGITDQAGHPAMLPDGRVALPWVDRFQTHSIRARLAASVDAPFDAASEVVIYTHPTAARYDERTGDLLADMALWSFGLPYAEALPDGDVLVVYYAGTDQQMDIHWARLRV